MWWTLLYLMVIAVLAVIAGWILRHTSDGYLVRREGVREPVYPPILAPKDDPKEDRLIE